MYDIKGLPAGKYLRISDDREGRELGVDRQDQDCDTLGARLGVNFVDTYCDNDISASTRSTKPREQFDRLCQDARSGRIKVIIAHTSSRLTRRPREHEDLIDLAIHYGIKYFFVASPSFDLNTAAGREIARHMAARDAAEAEDIRERVLRKKLQDAIDGRYSGGQRAYGYGKPLGIDPRTGKQILDYNALVEDEIAVLKDCRDRVIAGESTRSIMLDLNDRGVPTAKGCQWTIHKLKRTLLYKRYVIFDSDDLEQRGTREHQHHEYRAEWPGVFTRTEHELLAAILENNRTGWASGTPGVRGRRYLLTGLAYCGSCGGPMRGAGRVDGRTYIRRYRCKKYNQSGAVVGCAKVFRIAEPVEQLVAEAVLTRFDSPEVAEALAPVEDKARVNELTQELVHLHTRRERLAEEYALDPFDDYRTMVATIKAKQVRLESELSTLRSTAAKQAMLPALSTLRAAWEQGSLEWRHSVIKLLVARVVIHPSRRIGKATWNGWRFDPDAIEVEWTH